MRAAVCNMTKLSLLGILMSLALPLWAQSDPADESGSDSAEAEPVQLRDRSRILYIDVPVPVIPGQEPEFPQAQFTSGAAQSAELQDQARIIEDYASAINDIERQGGAWDQLLVEELTALGALQQQQGQHLQATETLTRALHVNRINSGLHAIDQVPVVEQLIESYLALGDWANVDLYQNYLYYVQHRAYGGNDPRLIPVLNTLGLWNIEAFNLGFGEPLGIRLSTAQLLFASAARMVGTYFGSEDERLVPYLRNIARSAYLVSQYPDYMREVDGPEYRASQQDLGRQLGFDRLRNPRGFGAGREALLEVVEYFQVQPGAEYELAEAVANLADWNLIFERYRRAEELYGEAWKILAEQENSEELLERLFGQVIPIPTFAQLPTNLLLGASDSQDKLGLQHDYADVRMDVGQDGAPRRVEVITEENEANDRQLSRLRREVRDTVFRPLIVGGEIRESSGHVFRYRYWF
jgi:hypothetical protein